MIIEHIQLPCNSHFSALLSSPRSGDPSGAVARRCSIKKKNICAGVSILIKFNLLSTFLKRDSGAGVL